MRTDVAVVGSGMAGLSFALAAARFCDVTIVTKKERAESNTNYAQGGIAAVFGGDDSFALHREDTFRAGAGLCHPEAVEVLVREGPARVRELIALGVGFTRDAGELSLGREGGHSRRRIVRADDLTGREIERALLDAVEGSPRIHVLENHLAVDLLSAGGGAPVHGVELLGPDGALHNLSARAVMLASGGCGQVYRHTTNPAIATGDGVAMAYRAGARVANMEFIQFHPTALHPASARAFLISEAVRGEGAVLLRADGSLLMEGAHPQGSLAPRDVVAREIDRALKSSGDPYVLLDCSPIPEAELRARFPNILAETRRRGLDILRDPLPVVPAAHYACGGVVTDTLGQTSLPGLFATGEVACTGVHGANRLASNSLLEAVVFAHRAAERLRTLLPELPLEECPVRVAPRGVGEGVIPVHDRAELRALMWDLVGIVRGEERLAFAEDRLRAVEGQIAHLVATTRPDADLLELRNLMHTALLIVRSARMRRESRGLHRSLEHPRRDNERFLRDTVLVIPDAAGGEES